MTVSEPAMTVSVHSFPSDNTIYIPVHTLYQMLTVQQCNIMIDVYVLTDCETTSSFYGHMKKTAFGINMKMAGDYQALYGIGEA